MKQINVHELLNVMEMSGALDSLLCGGIDINQGRKLLEKFKEDLKIKRKELAKLYHPDKTGGSLEKMQCVNGAYDILNQLNIQPQPVMHYVRVQPQYYYGGSYSSTTSTTGTGWW